MSRALFIDNWGLMLPRVVELGVVAVGARAWWRIPVYLQFEQEVDSVSTVFHEVWRYHFARLERPSFVLVTDWITDAIWVRRWALKLLRRCAEAVHRASEREASIILDRARERLAYLGHVSIPLRGQCSVGEPTHGVRVVSAAYDRVIESSLLAWSRSQFGVFYCDALIDGLPAVYVDTVIHGSVCVSDLSGTRFHHTVMSWTWTWLLCPHHAPREMLGLLPHRVLRSSLSVTIIFGRNPCHECLVFAWLWSHVLV